MVTLLKWKSTEIFDIEKVVPIKGWIHLSTGVTLLSEHLYKQHMSTAPCDLGHSEVSFLA